MTLPIVYYVYDPLCGYCNIARPEVSRFVRTAPPGVNIGLVHRNLFESHTIPAENAELMAKIHVLGGDVFSEFGVEVASNQYFENIKQPNYELNSNLSALVCAAVEMTDATKLLEYINRIQVAVFYQGLSPDQYSTYIHIANELGIHLVDFNQLISMEEITQRAADNALFGRKLLGETKRTRVPALILQDKSMFHELDVYRCDTALAELENILHY